MNAETTDELRSIGPTGEQPPAREERERAPGGDGRAGSVVLITGCSTGIGRATAATLAEAGYRVVATARQPETLADLGAAMTRRLDVGDDRSIDAAVRAVLERYGRIDALVNNAGYAVRGAVEELEVDAVARMFDTNVLGIIRLVHRIAPAMRMQGSGRIVNVGSLAGKFPGPANGAYAATKHAVEALSDAMRWELASFGIPVILIEPGAIRTRFEETVARGSRAWLEREESPYAPLYARVAAVNKNNPLAGGRRTESPVSQSAEPSRGPPITHHLTLAYICSLVVAVLLAAVSAAGFVLGSVRLYGVEPNVALGVSPSTAGVLVPGFLAQDAYILVVGLPILLGSLWLARRGALIGLLLWPGALFYVLYTSILSLVSAPFNVLFLPLVALVALSAYTTVGLVASIDGEQVRQRLTGVVPARIVGGILVGLAVLTLAQDAGGVLTTSLAGGAPVDPVAHHVWLVDLAVEVPAVLVGGVLLWRRSALGYVAGAGLLLQYGLTPLGLAATLALQPIVTAVPIDAVTIVGLLVFSVVSFAPLTFFVRGAAPDRCPSTVSRERSDHARS